MHEGSGDLRDVPAPGARMVTGAWPILGVRNAGRETNRSFSLERGLIPRIESVGFRRGVMTGLMERGGR